jgi:hypothetical protein
MCHEPFMFLLIADQFYLQRYVAVCAMNHSCFYWYTDPFYLQWYVAVCAIIDQCITKNMNGSWHIQPHTVVNKMDQHISKNMNGSWHIQPHTIVNKMDPWTIHVFTDTTDQFYLQQYVAVCAMNHSCFYWLLINFIYNGMWTWMVHGT